MKVMTFDFGGKQHPNNFLQLQQAIDATAAQHSGALILGTQEEDTDVDQLQPQLEILHQQCQQLGLNFCALFNHFSQYTYSGTSKIDLDFVDFMLLKLLHHNASLPMQPKGSKILFLTGKPNGVHRAPLLYKFFQNQQHDRLIWSLFVPEQVRNKTRAMMPYLNDQQWQEFLELQRSPDQRQPSYIGQGLHMVDYFRYDRTMYLESNVSLVSESSIYYYDPSSPRVTEKTYRAIENYHAFVLAGVPGTLKRLNQLGYQTFEQWLPYPNYDSELEHEQRLHQVYENVIALNDLVNTSPGILDNVLCHNKTVNQKRFQSDVEKISRMLGKYHYHGNPLDVLLLYDLGSPPNTSMKIF